jgi:ribose 1,5-bisphosphate isomerase
MIPPEVEKICQEMRTLKIQGARKVAIAAVRALGISARKSHAKTQAQFYADLIETADALAAVRPTEPMLRNSLQNAVRFVLLQMKKQPNAKIDELKALVKEEERNYFANVERSLKRISEFGAKNIRDGSVVMIHCHSNTLMGILKRTSEMGKDISIICTETRPKFQGHLSAQELNKAGIKVTMIVDSAVANFISDCDMVLVGADAITAAGDLLNKIGTRTIAQVASFNNVPFYSAAELHKFDPLTRWGVIEEIEERPTEELASGREWKGIKIRNPAFDVTPAKLISAYITEEGLVPPQGLSAIAMKNFEEIFQKRNGNSAKAGKFGPDNPL